MCILFVEGFGNEGFSLCVMSGSLFNQGLAGLVGIMADGAVHNKANQDADQHRRNDGDDQEILL